MWAVGTSADGSAASPLLTTAVTTDNSGDFTITNDYTCPAANPAINVYLTAVGGNPGLAPGTNNANISLIAALGPCNTLTPSTFIWVDEATTVASVFPFTQFMTSYSQLGSGSSDASQFETAFSQVSEFVDTSNGTSPGPNLPTGDGADTAKLYTLSDIVATCINSPGGVAGDGSACGNLFLYATPSGGPAPTDVVGALIDIANNPTNNMAQLFGLAPSDGPFQPTLPLAPTDWTIRIQPTITLSLPSTLIGNGNTLTGTVNLSQAPGSTLTINLSSSQPGAVTLNSATSTTVSIAGGTTSGTFAYEGVAGGTSVLEASATGYISTTASVSSTASLISLGTLPTIAPGQTVSLPLSLGTAAPTGGVTVNFATAPTPGGSAPATLASVVPSSVFIASGLTVPTANPQVTGGTIGSTQITANATGYAPDVATANVSVTAAFNPTTLSMPVSPPAGSLNLTISAPAPAGGITFTLGSNNLGVATVPMTATILQGATSVSVPVTGVAAGTATISASSAGITTATATVNVGAGITVGSATIGQFMQGTINVSLATTPTAPVNVTVSSGSTAVLLSKTSTGVGSSSLVYSSLTTSSVGTIYVQGQPLGAGLSGSATITAVASSGYSNGTGTVTVYPSGFIINPSTGTINTTTLSPPTNVTVEPAILNPGTLTYYGGGQLSPGPSIAYAASYIVPLSIPPAGSGVGTIGSATFSDGDSSDPASFQPTGAGSTTISIQSQPGGFSIPAQYQSVPVTVTAPTISVGSATIGQFMQGTISISLQTAPKSPITVTVTSGTPGAVLLSSTGTSAATGANGTVLTFTNVTSTSLGTIYVQGQGLGGGATGSSVITVVAPGYTNGTGTISVMPTGFVINPSQGSINTTTLSTPTNVTLDPAVLNPSTLAYAGGGTLTPGIGPFNVNMVSSAPATGTISTPVTFNGGDSSDTASFQPVAAGGPITLSIQGPPPAGFATPSQYQSISATVTAPAINVGSPTIGQFMQSTIGISLATAPKTPITVTVTSGTPGAVLLSSTGTTSSNPANGTTLTFNNVTSTSLGTIYIQGQSLGAGATGSSVITVAAPGYTNGTGTVTVQPTGFVINPSQGPINTTTFSTPTTVTLQPAILTPGTLAYAGGGSLTPGAGLFNVSITSSNLATGTISTSPVIFNGGDSSASTTFQPVASGTSTLSLGTTPPAGFSLPSNYQSIGATVTAPNATISGATIGANMQSTLNVSLGTAPPSAVTVTVTSNGPSIATISKSGAVVGGTSLTFTNVTSTSVGTIYVQGQTVGTTTVTVAAPGYNNGNGNITVMPSGFLINPSQGTISTNTLAVPTTVTLEPAILNPGVLTYAGSGALNPGIGPFDVPISSSPSGTMTVSPVVFNGGDSSDSTAFQPTAAGSNITISLGAVSLASGGIAPPTAFSTPSQYQTLPATVTAPAITLGSTTVGANMQGTINVSLGATPQVPMDVTIAVTGGVGNVLLSKSPTSVGTNPLKFTSVTSTNVGTVYVQGQLVGSATLTGSAVVTSTQAGGTYTNGTGTITVNPSGFVINPSQGNITTTSFSLPTTVTLEPAILTPGVFTYAGSGELNPGIGPFDVTLTPSPAGPGVITTSPVVFNPSDSTDSTTFKPQASGMTTLTIGSPTLAAGGTTPPTAFSTPSNYQSITATVTAPNITVGSTTIGEYMQGTVNVSLGVTPQVPVNVTITSSNANVLLATSPTGIGLSSVMFSSVTSTNVGTVYLQGQSSTGATTLTAIATNTSNGAPAGYNQGTGTVTVNPSGFVINPNQGNITATPQSSPTTITFEPAILNPGILTYAGTGPLDPNVSFTLSLIDTNRSIGTLSTYTVSFPPGASSATTVFQPGMSPGEMTIGIADPQSAPFSTPSQYQSLTATVTAPSINISNTTTGVSLETPISVSLSATPLTPITVTITSNNTSIATVSKSAATFGQPSVTFTNVTTNSVGTIYVQGQTLGTTTLTATASGYNTGTGTVTVNPSGFVINPSQGNISTTPTSSATTVTLEPAILTPGILTFAGSAELNPGIGPFNVGITSTNTVAGNITTSPVVFHGGDTTDSTTFQPAAAGTANLVLGAQPAGFSTPTQYQQITANVAAALGASIGGTTTGVDLETPVNVELGTAPGSPGITVTVSIANGTGSAVISNSSSAAGVPGGNVTFNNVTGTSVGTVWVQGLTTGTATLTVAAPGYASGTGAVTINPSGFIITSGNISTTTFSPPTTINVQPAILNPGILTLYTYGQLSPGVGSPQIDVSNNGNAAIGTITTSPVTFTSGSSVEATSFQPMNPGSTTVALGAQPVGFSLPSQQQYTQINVNVVAPSSNINNVVTGVNLEAPTYIDLGVAPSGMVPLTVSIANSPSSPGPNVANISTSPTVAGGSTLTINATTSTIGPIYVQGLTQGTAIITVTPGSEYASSTGTVTVNPSGFIISSGNITTTPTSSPTTVTISPAVLTPGLLTFYGYGQLSPGAGPYPYSLAVSSGNALVGNISTSPVNLNAGDTSDSTTFVPAGTGLTTVTLGPQPAGFSTPSQTQYTQVVATVVAPDGTSIGNVTTGVNMQSPATVTLGSAPSAPINVTISSLDPAVATVSSSASVAGTVAAGISSITFTNVTSSYVGTVYIQGQTAGTASLQVTNTGTFTTGTATTTVNPSGFVINSGNITTSLSNSPTVMVAPAVLNPGVLTLYSYGQLNPGIGPYNVALSSANGAVGSISTSPVTFSGDSTSASTSFVPVGAGTTTVNLGAPPASGLPGLFSTPSQYQQVTATVTAPGITVGNVVTGVNMENPLVGITLSVAPTSPVNVTVTSNNGAIAVVSSSATVAGTVAGGVSSYTFTNVTTTNVGTIWIQGQSLGSTTITVSAAGYTSGIGLATVDPSGFVLQTGNFATTHTSSATTIPIYAAVLTPSTLNYLGSAQLNPGISVSVPFSSTNLGIGTISPSPSIPFNGGDASENATFTPAGGVGTSTLKLGVPTGATGFSTPSQTATQQIIATVD